jgi:hypothetical protein
MPTATESSNKVGKVRIISLLISYSVYEAASIRDTK